MIGFIWDIDGVVVDSPHEKAWRITALKWGAREFSSEFYFKHVASKPRFEGGDAILELLGLYELHGARSQDQRRKLLEEFCSQKDRLVKELISRGEFQIFPDAVSLILEARDAKIPQAAVSASKNARSMLIQVGESKLRWIKNSIQPGTTLYSLFDIDCCGMDLGGKIGIQKYASQLLSERGVDRFVVFEDAPSGVNAAKSLGFIAVGVFRIGDPQDLVNADLIVKRIPSLSQLCKDLNLEI